MKPRSLRSALRIHPDAIVAPLGRGKWYPVLHLIWLAWMIAAPWYVDGGNQPRVFVITAVSLLVFIPLYFRAWYGDGARVVWNTTAMALLGLLMIPVNTSWSYVIYAAVLIPYCTTPRRSLLWLALLMAAFIAVASLQGFGLQVCLAATGMCILFSLVNLISRVNSRHDAALRLSHDEVRRLAATAERERIGRDLHDLLGHTLSLITVKSELARRLFERDAEAAQREIAEIERIARDALAQVRSAVTGIRTTGIAAELASTRLLLESSGITVSYAGQDLELSIDAETALAMCLREAVTNVQRHARASRVRITLAGEGRMALLAIDDDGRGGVRTRGNGLTGIDERLAGIGGRSTLGPAKGGGTRLELRAPIDAIRDASAPTAAPDTRPVLGGLAA